MKQNLLKKIVSVILLLLLVISIGYRQDVSVNASESTGVELASHVIKAHHEGRPYVYGSASYDAVKSPEYLNLKKEYKGDDVKDLQGKLQTLAVLENQPTGIFEEHTEAAVKAVQKEYAQRVTRVASPEFNGLLDSVIFDQKNKQAVQAIIFKTSEVSSKALAEVPPPEETHLKDGEFLIEIVWGAFLLFSVAGGALLVFCLRSNPAWLHTVRKKYLRIKQMIKR